MELNRLTIIELCGNGFRMSAHKLFCYAPHRNAVVKIMQEMGAIISRDSPHAIHEPNELRGLEHISFMMVRTIPLPDEIKQQLVAQGALLIIIDDSYERIHAIAAAEHEHA